MPDKDFEIVITAHPSGVFVARAMARGLRFQVEAKSAEDAQARMKDRLQRYYDEVQRLNADATKDVTKVMVSVNVWDVEDNRGP